MEDTEYELGIFCSQARLSVVGLGCIHLSGWSRESYEDLQTTQADTRTEGCLHKRTAGPIAEDVYIIEHGEVEQVPAWSLPSCILVSLVCKVLIRELKKKKKCGHYPSYKTFDLQSVPA